MLSSRGEGLKSRQDQQRLREEITDRLEYKRCEEVDARMDRHEQTVRPVWKEIIQDEIAALLGDDDKG